MSNVKEVGHDITFTRMYQSSATDDLLTYDCIMKPSHSTITYYKPITIAKQTNPDREGMVIEVKRDGVLVEWLDGGKQFLEFDLSGDEPRIVKHEEVRREHA